MIDYLIRVENSPRSIDASQWDALLAAQPHRSPFMRHAYLSAMFESGSASEATGWSSWFFTVTHQQRLVAACVVYLKTHSYGEYVFDWAWANAYHQHGVPYYPKAVAAIPFTPVPGARLLAVDDPSRRALLDAVVQWCKAHHLSSLHFLFCSDADLKACIEAGFMQRHTVQFHWKNTEPRCADFDDFLQTLAHDKRKKIRQERKKVRSAGVSFEALQGPDISADAWDFFYRCYERTYLEHGNPPYLNRDFFARMARTMPENWLLFIGSRQGQPIACSLIGLDPGRKVAYGRYWGAVERVDCLHFEACYYAPLQWCIANGYERFEGGAQGEHKMARALMPAHTSSAHWIAHPDFAQAVEKFLAREAKGITGYLEELEHRSPFRAMPPSNTAHRP